MKCILCGKTIVGSGHNPVPLSEKGGCCDKCNQKVIIARLKDTTKQIKR
jgi:hypothetical protein